jgi:hypothetical protein
VRPSAEESSRCLTSDLIAFRDPVSEGKVDHVIGVDTHR